jgi:uncharacterized phage protein (TIGR01671 family)
LLDENSDRRKNKRAIKRAGTRPAVDREAVNLREKDHISNIPYLGKILSGKHGRFCEREIDKMREIKFKAVYEGKVYEVTNIIFPGEHTGAAEIKVVGNKPGDYVCKWVPFKKCTLIQYTGLKDKNDKEIYEGDIVKAESNEYDYVIKFGEYKNEHDSEYSCNGWYAELIGDGYKCSLNMPELLEVIGNVYANPELLEEQHV